MNRFIHSFVALGIFLLGTVCPLAHAYDSGGASSCGCGHSSHDHDAPEPSQNGECEHPKADQMIPFSKDDVSPDAPVWELAEISWTRVELPALEVRSLTPPRPPPGSPGDGDPSRQMLCRFLI